MANMKKAAAAVALALAATAGPVTCSSAHAPDRPAPPSRPVDPADLLLLGIGVAGVLLGRRASRIRRPAFDAG